MSTAVPLLYRFHPPHLHGDRKYETHGASLLTPSSPLQNMSTILTHLRTSPAPNPSPNYPLLPNSPPANHLPLHPILYLTLAIDSVAPLMRIRSQRGAAGGGTALQIPMPLGLRQRRRQAFMWILASAEKKKGGTSEFAKRLLKRSLRLWRGGVRRGRGGRACIGRGLRRGRIWVL